jgi:hypothetical protein
VSDTFPKYYGIIALWDFRTVMQDTGSSPQRVLLDSDISTNAVLKFVVNLVSLHICLESGYKSAYLFRVGIAQSVQPLGYGLQDLKILGSTPGEARISSTEPRLYLRPN